MNKKLEEKMDNFGTGLVEGHITSPEKIDNNTGSIKEQIEKLNRPPTPEEKLACCMEDLALKSSTEQNTT